MPTVTEQRLVGWAHCEDPFCSGNQQESVEVVCTTTVHTFRDNGGDLPGPERSFEHYALADESDAPCPACGKPRAAAAQKRPVYPASQYPQDALLKLIREGASKPMSEPAAQRDGELDDLKAQIAEMRALLAEKANKPGRKPAEPKDPEV